MRSRIIGTIGLAVLVGVIQSIVGLKGNGAAILSFGALMGVLPYGLWKLRESDSDSDWDWYLPACAAVTGIAVGGLGSWVVRAPQMERLSISTDIFIYDWMAIGIGALVSGLCLYREWRLRAWRCDCCQQPLGRNPQQRPRDDHWVCAKCWRDESLGGLKGL